MEFFNRAMEELLLAISQVGSSTVHCISTGGD